jgi:site-specific recombinase XerD
MANGALVKAAADKYVKKSVAVGTMKAYKKEWRNWLNFARERGYRLAPPRPLDLEDYLVLSVATRASVAVLETISASVNWHCAEVGAPSPFEDRRITLMVRGMKSDFRRPAQPRLPFTKSHIRAFMDLGTPDNLGAWRAAVILSVCFSDFLRFSEVVNVRLEDIEVSKGSVCFRVQKAKNHRLGFDVTLSVDKKCKYCVGAYLLRFLESGLRWLPGSSGFLCCKIEKGRLPSQSIGYSSLHASCKSLIKAAGLDPSKFSTHSGKRGSATTAVSAGCSDAELTSMGRRRSANTGTSYVHNGPEFRKRLAKRFSV